MKNFTRILAIIIFSSLIIFISCKKGGGSDPDPLDEAAAKLTGVTWVATSISKNGVEDGIGDWSNFTISFEYNTELDEGQYTVNGIPPNDGAEDVFGSGNSQSWTFENQTNTSVVVRQDGIRVNVSVVEDTSLTLSFNIPASGSRIAGFDGSWEFTLVPQ